MDYYDYSEVKRPRRRSSGIVWNVLTILVIVVILFIVVGFIWIYLNPSSSLNPFPPRSEESISTRSSTTPTAPIALVPSRTATNEVFQSTNTPGPTFAPLASATPVSPPTSVPATRLAEAINYAFVVREGNPAAIDGAQFHPDAGCKWLGVAGQATSLNGEAVKGLFVHLGGSLPGTDNVENLTMTGLAPQYGQGGFEITISDHLIASTGQLWIQLLDQDNLPLSDRIYFDTYDDCLKNLVIIYFDQAR